MNWLITSWNWFIGNITTCIPWILSAISVGVSIRVAYISKATQELVSNKTQQIALIDNGLTILREDMVRFYSAQASTNGREHIGLTQVAYQILCANPISTSELKEAAYKVLQLDNIATFAAYGKEVEPDEKVKGITSMEALKELSDEYIKIVKQQQEQRNELLS